MTRWLSKWGGWQGTRVSQCKWPGPTATRWRSSLLGPGSSLCHAPRVTDAVIRVTRAWRTSVQPRMLYMNWRVNTVERSTSGRQAGQLGLDTMNIGVMAWIGRGIRPLVSMPLRNTQTLALLTSMWPPTFCAYVGTKLIEESQNLFVLGTRDQRSMIILHHGNFCHDSVDRLRATQTMVSGGLTPSPSHIMIIGDVEFMCTIALIFDIFQQLTVYSYAWLVIWIWMWVKYVPLLALYALVGELHIGSEG